MVLNLVYGINLYNIGESGWMSNILSIFTIEKFIKTGANVRVFRKRMVNDRG
jgi:hypothetical protein